MTKQTNLPILCHQFLIFIFFIFYYSSQQFDEEDEDETDGKPNPAAAAKAALGTILVQFKHLRKFVLHRAVAYLSPLPRYSLEKTNKASLLWSGSHRCL